MRRVPAISAILVGLAAPVAAASLSGGTSGVGASLAAATTTGGTAPTPAPSGATGGSGTSGSSGADGTSGAAGSPSAPVRLWLAGKVTYRWSGDQCATSSSAGTSSGSSGASGSSGTSGASAICHETFTNVVTASVSTHAGPLLAPRPGEQLSFTWYGEVFTPKQAGQRSCTIVNTGTGTATTSANGAGPATSVTYDTYVQSSPDCTVDDSAGPAPSTPLESPGSCLSCGAHGYLGKPIYIDYSAPGARVLDNAFPVNTNTV